MFAKYKWYIIGAVLLIAAILIYKKVKKSDATPPAANAGSDEQNTLLSTEQLRESALRNDLMGALN